jgi:hypothetical protein
MRQPGDESRAEVRYWQRRLRSRAFKRELTALLRRELTALAGERVRDIVDTELVRSMIREWETRMIDRAQLAEVIIEGIRHSARRRRDEPLRRLDSQLIADVASLVREGFALSAAAEDAIAAMMRQEFVRRLFTDIIFSAIVSFYQRVNPLFGAVTVRVLEEQIKGFIRFFMPMLQQQATAFIISQANQRVAMDFIGVVVREILEQPLPSYLATITPAQRRRLETLIRDATASTKLEAVVREATLSAWDDLYAIIADKRVGDLLRVDEQAAWFAERCVEFVAPALARSHVVEFIAAQSALAAKRRSRG